MSEDNLFDDIFQHRKNNRLYKIIGFGIIEATNAHAVIYQDIGNRLVYVRPTSEFFDGRFKFIGK